MRKAKLLIGNSSMGILEAPFYKIPVVNVGERQKGRLNAGNVEFVNYVKEEIVTSLHKAAFNKIYRRKIRALKNPYGRGDADIKILKFLKKVDLQDKSWYIKRKIFKEG
jgi:GDP/UDP-N,N'-diacetylbacillosamine 2-epimerase (hydrolysing)